MWATIIWLFCLRTWPVQAIVSSGRPGHGLVGYGISMDKPTCAYACKDAITNPLQCGSGTSGTSGTSVLTQSTDEPPPECYADNEPFLQTLAYCLSFYCVEVPVWRLEKFWELNVAGRRAHQPRPEQSYQETLVRMEAPPNSSTPPHDTLTHASLIDEGAYVGLYNAEYAFSESEDAHERYGLVLIVTTALLPVACSLLRFVPFARTSISQIHATLVYPLAFGPRYSNPVGGIISMPTRAITLFLFYVWVINIILSAVGIHSRQPNAWYATRSVEINTYIANRFGVLSFANIAISILFAGRNNVLSWITDWSHSTFLLIHRWVAFISVVEACLHSIIYLYIYTTASGYDYSSESSIPYWYWGIIATLSLVLLIPMSLIQLQRKVYEVFLSWHIVFSLLALVGCYLHVYLRFDHQWGYEIWIYIAFAFWAFDRLVRFLKMLKNGIRTAAVTVIDDDYIRLNVPNVFASGQAYLYFPTLTCRVWENHPFSVAAGLLARNAIFHIRQQPAKELPASHRKADPEMNPGLASDAFGLDQPSSVPQRKELGLTFFIRTRTGTTALLRTRTTLPVLIESSYGHNFFSRHGSGCLASYPNLICIAGGVGITAIVPLLAAHLGYKRLYWGVRSNRLVQALQEALGDDVFAGVESKIFQGTRMDLKSILDEEIYLESCVGSGTAILVSGPQDMVNEARAIVSKTTRGKKSAVIGFFEEKYGW